MTKKKLEAFYILWQPESSLPPTRRFTDLKEAREVAESMTRKHKCEFFIMKTEALCEISEAPIRWKAIKGK